MTHFGVGPKQGFCLLFWHGAEYGVKTALIDALFVHESPIARGVVSMNMIDAYGVTNIKPPCHCLGDVPHPRQANIKWTFIMLSDF